jgi:hypothetical protein
MSKGGGQGSYQQMQQANGAGPYGTGIGAFQPVQFFGSQGGSRFDPSVVKTNRHGQGVITERAPEYVRQASKMMESFTDPRKSGYGLFPTPMPVRGGPVAPPRGVVPIDGYNPNTQFRMPSFGPSYGTVSPYMGGFSGYGVPSNIYGFEQPHYEPYTPPADPPPTMVLPPEDGDGTEPPADGGVAGTPPADGGAVQTASDTTAPVTDAATTEQAVDPYAPTTEQAVDPYAQQYFLYQPQPTYMPYRPMPRYNPYGSGQFMQDYGGIGGFGRYDLGLAGFQY